MQGLEKEKKKIESKELGRGKDTVQRQTRSGKSGGRSQWVRTYPNPPKPSWHETVLCDAGRHVMAPWTRSPVRRLLLAECLVNGGWVPYPCRL